VPRPFTQVDVFTDTPYLGNALAVVHDADGLSTEQMQTFARWTNLSETTFLLPPTTADADYRVRIFTPSLELPFAGHPTLGTCHAWLQAGGTPRDPAVVRQECGAGIITIRTAPRLAFAAPALTRSGPLAPELRAAIAGALGLDGSTILDAAWTDNGPGWATILLASADDVLALRPTFLDQDIGVVGPHPEGSDLAFEVRAFFPQNGALAEDPVTGSLNAGVAQWLLETGRATAPYVARQGTAIGRDGRVFVSRDDDGKIWVGGGVVTCVRGSVEL